MLVWALCLLSPVVTLAFTFSYTAPTQCDLLTVFWSGGEPPFSLLITVPYDAPYNFSIPDSDFSSTSSTGNFTTTLNLPANTSFLLTMSDSTGFGSGGTTDTITVGPSTTNSDCTTTSIGHENTFNIAPTSPSECGNVTFTLDGSPVQPVDIFGIIPLGTAFHLRPGVIPTTGYPWTVDIAAGTRLLVMVISSLELGVRISEYPDQISVV